MYVCMYVQYYCIMYVCMYCINVCMYVCMYALTGAKAYVPPTGVSIQDEAGVEQRGPQ